MKTRISSVLSRLWVVVICLSLVVAPGFVHADESDDIDFIVEYDGLIDMFNDFDVLHNGARKSLLGWYESFSKTEDFRGHKKFAASLEQSGYDYLEIADQAAEVFASDPRNAALVKIYLNAALFNSDFYPALAKCTRTGNSSFCLGIFEGLGDQPKFEQAIALAEKVRNEATELLAAFESQYGSLDAARDAVQGGGSGSGLMSQSDAPVLLDIERAMSTLGYDPGPVDGVFDSQSQEALALLISRSEGVYPEDANGLMEALTYLLQDARDFPEDRDWGDNPDLNRKLAEVTGYLGGFSGSGFWDWVSQQPKELEMRQAVIAVRDGYMDARQQAATRTSLVSGGEVLATVNNPVAGAHECDRLAADIFDKHAVTSGVALWDIQSRQAISACENALETAPAESRFAFQLARAHVADEQAARARPVFAALAANGHTASAAHLGYLDYMGLDGSSDLASARSLLALAAENSDLALSILVDMLRNGDGGPKDPTEAARWLKIGIERSQNPALMQSLARMFEAGEGVEQDSKLAAGLRKHASGSAPLPSPATQILPLPTSDIAAQQEQSDQEFDPLDPTVLVPRALISPETAPELVYAGLPSSGQHWLAVSAPGLEGKTYYFLKMLEKGQTDGVITGPKLPAGNFEARLFLNWPEGAYTFVDTAPIDVTVDADITLRRRQLVMELESLLSGADFSDLAGKLRAARSGEVNSVRTVSLALIAKATQYAAVAAELGEVDPFALAMELTRYAAELMPEDAVVMRLAGVMYLAAPTEAGLIYDAESLLEYAVELTPDDRLARQLWIEALVLLTRYEAAANELLTLWPPREGEARLIGLVSDVYIALGQPIAGLELLDSNLPQSLVDAARLARATLNFSAGKKDEALTLIQSLAASSNPYFASIGKNMTPGANAPNAPLALPD